MARISVLRCQFKGLYIHNAPKTYAINKIPCAIPTTCTICGRSKKYFRGIARKSSIRKDKPSRILIHLKILICCSKPIFSNLCKDNFKQRVEERISEYKKILMQDTFILNNSLLKCVYAGGFISNFIICSS